MIEEFSGRKEIISGPEERTFHYPAGKRMTFPTKKDALAFVTSKGDKVRYLGKV